MDKPKKLYLRQLDNLFKDVRMLIILQRKTNVNLKAGLKRTASFEEWLLMLSTVLLCAVLSPIWLCTIPQTVAHQAPLSMGLSRQEYWSGLPFPSLGESSWFRDWTWVSCISRWILYHWATWGAPCSGTTFYNVELSVTSANHLFYFFHDCLFPYFKPFLFLGCCFGILFVQWGRR